MTTFTVNVWETIDGVDQPINVQTWQSLSRDALSAYLSMLFDGNVWKFEIQ